MPTFTGNVNLLIAAPMLQDLLVDKDGEPMAGGTITMYHDNSRTTLKNWYYQTGTPGNYTYIALPNPLTLSAAGTITDINGVDTIPFYYPFSETDFTIRDPYYVTIVNYAQTNQITRANFPFSPNTGGSANLINSYNNLIVNNGFWRNIAPNTVNTSPFVSVALNSLVTLSGGLYSAIVSPSQHDGFRYPDVEFFKDNINATDTLTFKPFLFSDTLPVTNTLTNSTEYYISHLSSANDGSAENVKYYQFPIALHINSLANVPFTVSIQAQNGGATPVVLTLQILQDTGTGTSSPVATPIAETTITLNSSWTEYTLTDVFPATTGLNVGSGSDDALYLLVSLPINTSFTVNFTKPSIYLTENTVPSFDWQTYDQANAIFNSPRTGDVRIALNPLYSQPYQWSYGWVPMNDGTIGYNANSMATYLPTARNNNDTWPLYNLIWSLFKPFTGISSNPICPMISSAGASVVYGANAYADFIANKSLSLTKMMGRVIMGTVPINALLTATSSGTFEGFTSVVTGSQITQTFTASSGAEGLLLTSTLPTVLGEAVQFTNSGGALPTGLSAATNYFAVPVTTTTFYVATTLNNAQSNVLIAFTNAGTGTNSVTNFSLVLTTATSNIMTLFNGCPITFTNNTSGASLPGGLGLNTIYYATPISNTTFTVSTTYNNALTGGYIAYSTAGTNTTTVYADSLAAIIGEYSHLQLVAEMAGHTHPATGGANFIISGSGAATLSGSGNAGSSSQTGINGGNIPFNITQAANFYNIYIKL